MSSALQQKLLQIPEDSMEHIQKRYGYDERKMNEAVDILAEWLKKQNHFVKKDFPRTYLEMSILGSKCSIERTKSRLEKLFTLHSVLPKFYGFEDIRKDFENLFFCSTLIVLPKLISYHRILFLKSIGNEFFDKIPYLDYYKLIIAYIDYLKMYDCADGYIIIVDYRDISIMNLLARLNPVELKEFTTIILEGYGLRIKGIHILTPSKTIDAFLKIVKPLFSPKVASRFQVHETLESLHQVISQRILPKELGGMDRSLKEIQEDWIDLLSSKESSEYFCEMKKAQVNEAYRVREMKNEDMGLPGTFRTLSVD
ncbi:uncharacterized protein LOC114249523 [Bombyx mandarina]|uniref:Uncharacterized protein LOC114249523 n=1 Tax=Bombyx mandarina TaxID=7092 RepID=A0A6J2KAI6_BOMMA|nr:uncharacterized protein LOC114249523 [Bombyx mandarina]